MQRAKGTNTLKNLCFYFFAEFCISQGGAQVRRMFVDFIVAGFSWFWETRMYIVIVDIQSHTEKNTL